MAKSESLAYATLLELINKGQVIQLEKRGNTYEVTVWPDGHTMREHIHYQGETLLEAVMKIK